VQPDGYFKVPRRLLSAKIPHERKFALVWMIGQASYSERTIGRVTLRIGETPVLSLTTLESEFGWSRKAVRVFLEYAVSPKCAEETGVRVRVGQKIQGHASGHVTGHVTGHTYLIGLVKDRAAEGHVTGHVTGHASGHSLKEEEGLEEGKKKDITPPSEGSAEGNGSSEKKTKRTRRQPVPLPADWQPTAEHTRQAEEWGIDLPAVVTEFRFYWNETKQMRGNWDLTFTKRLLAVHQQGLHRLNGKPRYLKLVGDNDSFVYEPGPERF
jgi:hypothetical protein